jgi:hypothetical protein
MYVRPALHLAACAALAAVSAGTDYCAGAVWLAHAVHFAVVLQIPVQTACNCAHQLSVRSSCVSKEVHGCAWKEHCAITQVCITSIFAHLFVRCPLLGCKGM